jgi:DNA-binding NarL/FixJ family response regulator
MKKISILLVDDHAAIRHGLRALLELEPDFKVLGEVENGRQAVKFVRRNPPDVVVMDLAMPVPGGLQATRQILDQAPRTKVLVLTSYGDDACVDRLMEAGASGFLIKQTAVNDLLRAIREVKNNKPFFTPAIAQRLQQRYEADQQWQPSMARLSFPGRIAQLLSTLPPPASAHSGMAAGFSAALLESIPAQDGG